MVSNIQCDIVDFEVDGVITCKKKFQFFDIEGHALRKCHYVLEATFKLVMAWTLISTLLLN